MKIKPSYKLFLLLAVPLLLQSCFVAKNYSRPELETESLYRTDNLPQDSISMADVSWRDLFKDEQLAAYIEQGLENNIDVRIALQNVLAAEAYVKQGKAGYYPTLSGTTSFTRTKNSENSQFGSFFTRPLEQYELSGTLSWEADVWGKIRSNKRAAGASYLQSVSAHQAVKTNLIAGIATTYFQLMALDKQLEVAKQTLDARKKSLETTMALKDAGQVTEVAVKQTKAQVHTTEIIVIDLENNIKLLENAFSILLGEGPQKIERGNLDNQSIDTDLSTGVPYLLLANRPDVMQAEYGLINAFELTNVAKSSLYPSLSLSATGGFQSLEFDNWLDASSLFSNLVGSLTQPIFNGRKLRTQMEVAKAQQEQALLAYKQALLTAGREVSDALYTYNAESQKLDARAKELEAYATAETYSEELLNNGLANYLEVLTARQNALNSELNYVDSQYAQLSAIVELYRALGGGWK
ncbi:TolC family protein [Muricauda ruestringensis]|jgi:NodT family efflux transporter outer membrane factor (OMF) lipoprotein|uniref:Multidrug transporter n=1 Tax=Flagellimonas marinaquae TaxID=254955 RepID=A0AA48HPZ3_9FLAO|nr:TolC family protein [Allomuricauda ruestringensis]MCA0958802.1 TolC family protein [Allomuricauda ruestringensis]BDW92231.1 multidrug transporter [Allomuricauda aquimarina]